MLLKKHKTTAHVEDGRLLRPEPFLVRLIVSPLRPKKLPIFAMELAGEIESIGKDLSQFKEGDQVFALTGYGLERLLQIIN